MSFLILSDIKKEYLLGENVVKALNGFSLTVEKGEFLAIAGKSGSGKTTVLNVLGCIDFPDSGSYTFNNRDVSHISESERTIIRKQDIGFIFQSFNLVPVLSAYENAEYPLLLDNSTKQLRKERVDYWLEKVGLYDKRHHRPNELSGGQRQRVAIARALVKNPKLVLADEPTASLDTATGTAIIELMQELNRTHQSTFVFSSHDDMVINAARRVVYIQDGKVIKEKIK